MAFGCVAKPFEGVFVGRGRLSLLVLLFFLKGGTLSASAETENQKYQGSLFDLRNIAFGSGQTGTLAGGWELYKEGEKWVQQSREASPTVRFWDPRFPLDKRTQGEEPRFPFWGDWVTYRTRLLLPTDTRPLGLFVSGSAFLHFRIFIDYKPQLIGGVGSVEQEEHNHSSSKIFPLPAVQEVEILIQMSTTTHTKIGIKSAPIVGELRHLIHQKESYDTLLAALLSILLCAGIFCIIVAYYQKKSDYSSLFFGFFTLLFALKILVETDNVILSFIPRVAALSLFTINHLLLVWIIFSSSSFFIFIFGNQSAHKHAVFFIAAICCLFSMLFLALPLRYYGKFHSIFIVCVFVIGFALFLIALAIIFQIRRTGFKKQMTALISIVGSFPLLATFFRAWLTRERIDLSQRKFLVGEILFVLSQLFLANRSLIQAFFRSKMMGKKLLEQAISYSRFVPSDFLRILAKDRIAEVSLGDHTLKRMVILFCDIRGFTEMSESMSPEEIFLFINYFFALTSPCIRQRGGFIDKYTGDGFMALFPEEMVQGGVDAALDIRERLAFYNSQRTATHQREIRIGIGIHMGDLMLGPVGEDKRMDNTVISGAVNLCSRIEGLTKEYGVDIAVSEAICDALPLDPRYKVSSLGKASVRGRKNLVTIYELLSGSSSSPLIALPETNRELRDFHFYL